MAKVPEGYVMLSAAVPADLLAALEARAAEDGSRPAAVVARALGKYLGVKVVFPPRPKAGRPAKKESGNETGD